MPSLPYSLLSYSRVVAGAWRDDPRGDAELLARFVDSGDEAAFRSGTFGGRAAEAAGAVLGAFPASSLGKAILRKSLWIMLACVCSLGIGLAAWQTSSARPDAGVSPELSSSSAKAVAEPDSGLVDRYGDPLPDGVLARLGSLHLRHVGRSPINNLDIMPPTILQNFFFDAVSVIFSRDGKMLITAGSGNRIQLWDAATGKLLRSFGESRVNRTTGSWPAKDIALSPDGKTLAARTGGNISLWEVATGKCLRVFSGGRGGPLTPAFSQDGRTLLSLSGEQEYIHRLHVWEVATGKEVRNQPLLPMNAKEFDRNFKGRGFANRVIFSPDGRILVTIHHEVGIIDKKHTTVYLWEAATGKELRHLEVVGRVPPGATAFSPDSRFLALSNTIQVLKKDQILQEDQRCGALHLWEVATGKEVHKWTPDPTEAYAVAFSPNGKLLATGSGFGPIRLWETATGKEIRQCQNYRAHVTALAFSPDGSMLASRAGVHDCTARLWEVASGKESVPLPGGHLGPVVSVVFAPDGKSLISGGRDGLVSFWNAKTGQEQRPPLRAGDFQALAALSADGKTILTIGNRFPPDYPNLLDAVFRTPPTQICVWDRATGRKLRQFEGPAGPPQSLALSPDGKFLALTFPRRIYLLEVAAGKVMREIASYSHPPTGAGSVFSPDGKTLAVSFDGGTESKKNVVQFYALATGKNIGSFKAQGHVICCLAFSPDGQTLAVGGQDDSNSIRLWRRQGDEKGWMEAGTLTGHKDDTRMGIVCGLAFSPDGKTLASASEDGTLRLWEVATGDERRRFVGHRGDVWCLGFAPDGRRLAAGGSDTAILVWDVTGRLHSGQLRPAKLSDQELQDLWDDLTDVDDAARAGQAVWTLAAAPAQAIPLLRQHLRPVAPAGPRIDRLIADLGSDTFAVRQKAMDELAKLGEAARPALRQALTKSTLEKRRRLEQVLESLGGDTFPLSGEKLRSHRALEVLGQMDTLEARQLLEALARGAAGARQTLEARTALKCQRIRVNATKP